MQVRVLLLSGGFFLLHLDPACLVNGLREEICDVTHDLSPHVHRSDTSTQVSPPRGHAVNIWTLRPPVACHEPGCGQALHGSNLSLT